jgi:phosphate:Na+ symporter
MPVSFAIYLIIGVNVGSATPLFLSAIGAKTNAKRAAVIYFIFDFVGMIIFTPIALLTNYTTWLTSLSENGSVQVAAGHIIFKVVTALFLLPFVPIIVKVSEKIVKPKEHETVLRFQYIDKKLHDNATATALQVASEVERMAGLVRKNFTLACDGFIANDISKKREIEENEELINWLNHNITDFIVTMTSQSMTADTSEYIGKVFHVITDLERIGDHALNILQRTISAKEYELDFTEAGMNEFKEIYAINIKLFDGSMKAFNEQKLLDSEEHQLHFFEDTIDYLTSKAQDNHVQRLKDKKCQTASGVVFTKTLQDLERVGDHSYNIAWAARTDKNLIKQI